MSGGVSALRHWVAELKRRKVFRVAAVYLVAAWLVIQVADVVFEPMGVPAWSLKLVIVLAAIGFPFACALAWAFDVTRRGIERTPSDPGAAAESAPRAAPAPPAAAFERPAVPAAAIAATGGASTAESVAVLPFSDLSPARDHASFCDGIAEEIINALCYVRGLRVASRTSSFQFKDRPTDVREIGRLLGVGTVLEAVGMFRRAIGHDARFALAHAGRARELVQRSLVAARDTFSGFYNAACTYALLGDPRFEAILDRLRSVARGEPS